ASTLPPPRPRQLPPPAVAPPAARALIRPSEAAPAEPPPSPETPPAKPAPSAHRSAQPAVTASALFEQGQKLRREGHGDAAVATYRRLQAMFPETPEARLSSAFAGQLLLGQRRPGEALAQFDRHLKMGGEAGQGALAA